MKESTDEKGIWEQIEGIAKASASTWSKEEKELREAIMGLFYKLFKRRPELFQKYKLGIPEQDIIPLLGEYGEMVLEELKARGGPTKAPIEFTKAAEEYLKIIIELYGPEENNRRKAPLYPHVPRRQEPLFPHTPHSR